MSPRRGVPAPAVVRDCATCGGAIRIAREVDDSSRTLILNADQVPGGTVILLNDRDAQIVPPGKSRGYTLHSCRETA